MFKTKKLAAAALLACAGAAQAAVPIQFDFDGPGPLPPVTIVTFDWLPSSALAVDGNPSGGLASGDKVTILSHAKLATVIDANSNIIVPPAGIEVTFVAGFGESTAIDTNGAVSFNSDLTNRTNYFEMWVSSPDISNLAGTGFNTGKRIFLGLISTSSGNYAGGLPVVALDNFVNNDYPAIATITGSGSTQIAVNVVFADADYFPGLTPAIIDSTKVFFNTSTVTPYQQVDPSAMFVSQPAGAVPDTAANVGPVNGGLQQSGQDLNFELQADANQSFEPGTEVTGACRVTYGGNDRNGNIADGSLANACYKVSNKAENCYTFGGQVGAPTANPALGGPFGEHTHHQFSGPAGDFVFHAGTHSAPKNTRIEATACKDPGACQAAAANAGFKQIDFEGTGSFKNLDSVAKAYFANKGVTVASDSQGGARYWFRVDMDDFGEPGSKTMVKKVLAQANQFLSADQNNPLSTADPLLKDYGTCKDFADVYQFYICPSDQPCDRTQAMYEVRGFLTGGNIQLHKVIK